ncbi:hypothetical protein SCLCIDRAFT_94971, partial [Scleroderma citrinum Foug A]
EATMTRYHAALNKLECLVIRRLFELQKLLMSGTGKHFLVVIDFILLLNLGYKLRQQISKGLQQWSEAIRNAITRYNTQARLINRPMVTWKDIAEYSFLGEFDLLHNAHLDIRECDWTKPAYREATLKYFKLCRAKEEITHLNVEICRLHTLIHDEAISVANVINKLQQSNRMLAQELHWQYCSHLAINAIHINCLDRIKSCPDFSG